MSELTGGDYENAQPTWPHFLENYSVELMLSNSPSDTYMKA